MSAVTNFRSYATAMRQLYGRTPVEIIHDLRAVARVLAAELDAWTEPPSPAALTSAETSVDGLRRLLGQLRLATQSTPQDAA